MTNHSPDDSVPPRGQLLIYRDGATRLHVRLDGQTVWLTQAGMAELYQTTPQNITQHIRAIFDEGELAPEATCKDYLQVRDEGGREVRRSLKHYSLDVIIAVGYRVRSIRGTAFRQWATSRLAELLAKGFTLDDERIKAGRTLGADYFDELLERIRDIRASERLFYQKITDIFASSIDYALDHPAARDFFATVQTSCITPSTARRPRRSSAIGLMPTSPIWGSPPGRTPPAARFARRIFTLRRTT